MSATEHRRHCCHRLQRRIATELICAASVPHCLSRGRKLVDSPVYLALFVRSGHFLVANRRSVVSIFIDGCGFGDSRDPANDDNGIGRRTCGFNRQGRSRGVRQARCAYECVVKAVTYKIIGDHHASEDAAQDAFVIAFRSLPRLRNRALFGGWVARIARRHAQRLSQSRRHDLPLQHAAEVVGHDNDSTDYDSERLLALLMQLPERERQPLLLRHFGGHSVANIARMSERPVGTITKQLSRGYVRLRKQLQEIEI